MAVVTDNTLHLGHRFMLDLVIAHLSLDLRMAVEANLPCLSLDETGLIGTMGTVTGQAISFGKGRMSGLFGLFGNQVLMTGQTELPFIRGDLEQPGVIPAMGRMATRAFSPGKGSVLTEKPFFHPSLSMTGETESRLFFCQQFTPFGLVRGMTFTAKAFFGRPVRLARIGIGFPVMTGETEGRCLALEQSLAGRCMTTMAGQTLAFTGGSVDTVNTFFLLPLFMTVQADLGRCLGQHTGILTGMNGMARLAISRLDRLVLRHGRDLVMTGQTKPASKRLDLDRGTLDLVTVAAIAAPHRLVNHLPEQCRITGTVLGMAVNATGGHRITLVGLGKVGTPHCMAGGAQIILRHLQQSREVGQMRSMAGAATTLHRLVDSLSGKSLRIMAPETELCLTGGQQLLMFGIVRVMANLT